MVTPQSPAGTIYNSSPSRPSPREVVQIPDAVRTRCTRGARAVRILPLNARNKKTVTSCNSFFAVSRLSRLTRLTAKKATSTPLEGKDASAEQSVESPEARPQPSVDTPTEEEDTRPKVLIREEWRKVPDGYPADASGQLECDQLFIDDLCKQLVKELRTACQLNPNPGAKPKSGDTKTDLIYKRAFCNYL